MEARIEVVSKEVCTAEMVDADTKITDDMICAGNNYKDACQVDQFDLQH